MRLIDELTSAVGEAFNNIAVHGYCGRMPGIVRVDIDVVVEWITVELRDFGVSFDPTIHAALHPFADLGRLPESGMGVFIMHSFVERVTYLPGNPNVLTLAKRIWGGQRPGGGHDDAVYGQGRRRRGRVEDRR